jgi:opacity protein-like surface antigen
MKGLEAFSYITSTALLALFFMPIPAAHSDEKTDKNSSTDGWTGNVSAYLGHKSVDDDDWPDLDSQRSVGIISDIRKQSWPVSIAVDLIFAGDADKNGADDIAGGTMEIHLGARKVFTLENSSFSPYVGGGLALVTASLENEKPLVTIDDDDTVVGAWIGVGAYYAVTPHINLGMDVRYSKAEVTLFDKDRETGGFNAGITLGYHW